MKISVELDIPDAAAASDCALCEFGGLSITSTNSNRICNACDAAWFTKQEERKGETCARKSLSGLMS